MPDLAPTILELAGLAPLPTMDGRSLAGLLQGEAVRPEAAAGWREELLIEYIATQEGVKQDRFGHILDSGNATFRGLRRIARGQDLAYFEFTDPYADWAFERLAYFELYNLSADPEQLVNAYATASVATRQELSQRLRAMYACVGSGCA